MNPQEILRIADTIHRAKNIDREVVFQAIETALVTAARRRYGDEARISVQIDRESGQVAASCNDRELGADEIEQIGRIGAQIAKQVITQKIREAERDVLLEEYQMQVGHLVSGVVQRNEAGATLVSLGNIEAILPRSEQIPGESYHPNQRVRALIVEVRPQGSRVRVILSRTRAQLVEQLFEQEIPEIAEGVIEIKALAREPGHRTKVAVYSSDQRVDCVGACVGVRGNRIRNIVDELSGERIDIIEWSSDPKMLITRALQPAEVDQVLLCEMIGRAIVLVREDQLSLAIGRKGQNVRLASKLCGWDIEIMTEQELDEQIDRAVRGFLQLDGVDEELAQRLVEQGYLSYDDLSVIEPEDLMEMGGLTAEQVEHIVAQAEARAEEAERLAEDEKRRARQEEAQNHAAKGARNKARGTQRTASADDEPSQKGESAEAGTQADEDTAESEEHESQALAGGDSTASVAASHSGLDDETDVPVSKEASQNGSS
ncbi:MAG: transcription termination/antitermination protein NusA [Pirellulaceae bacterium]|nr:MAG: transcription termination/antitermination protein NusA [Pirellulaceae bacterium]